MNQGQTSYIEQKLDDLRRAGQQLSSPTARDVFTHGAALCETAWLIEKQGGVIPNYQSQSTFRGQSPNPR